MPSSPSPSMCNVRMLARREDKHEDERDEAHQKHDSIGVGLLVATKPHPFYCVAFRFFLCNQTTLLRGTHTLHFTDPQDKKE